jgi:hypothetical protein
MSEVMQGILIVAGGLLVFAIVGGLAYCTMAYFIMRNLAKKTNEAMPVLLKNAEAMLNELNEGLDELDEPDEQSVEISRRLRL